MSKADLDAVAAARSGVPAGSRRRAWPTFAIANVRAPPPAPFSCRLPRRSRRGCGRIPINVSRSGINLSLRMVFHTAPCSFVPFPTLGNARLPSYRHLTGASEFQTQAPNHAETPVSPLITVNHPESSHTPRQARRVFACHRRGTRDPSLNQGVSPRIRQHHFSRAKVDAD
jgi:hypothetical protein